MKIGYNIEQRSDIISSPLETENERKTQNSERKFVSDRHAQIKEATGQIHTQTDEPLNKHMISLERRMS